MKCLYPRKLFAFLALACFADVNAFDFTSDGLYYNKLTDSTCEVTFKDSTFNSYSGMVVVPSVVNYEGTDYEVVKVGSKAFYDSKILSKVLLPDNITVIGDGAFKNCSKLVSFNFPENLDSICDNAFECCRNLKSPELKEGLKYIGAYAFAECNAILSVSVPNSVEVLGSSSFSQCGFLKSVSLGTGINRVCESVFLNCFSLNTIDIHDNITILEPSAFLGCTGLTSVTGCKNVEKMGSFLFSGTGLTSFVIPEKVTYISENAFSDCSNLTSVQLHDNVLSIGSGAFLMSGLKEIVVPNKVRSIGFQAFFGTQLESVVIGSDVRSIGDDAFYFCQDLKEITFLSNVDVMSSNAFSGCPSITKIIDYSFVPQKIDEKMFEETYGTITVHVCEGLKEQYVRNGWKYKMNIIDDLPYSGITKVSFEKDMYIVELDEYGTFEVSTDCPSLFPSFVFSVSDEGVLAIDEMTGEYYGLQEGKVTVTVKVAGTDLAKTVKVIVAKDRNSVNVEDFDDIDIPTGGETGESDSGDVDNPSGGETGGTGSGDVDNPTGGETGGTGSSDIDNPSGGDTPNGVEAVHAKERALTVKRMVNGRVVIERGSKVYSVSGSRIPLK